MLNHTFLSALRSNSFRGPATVMLANAASADEASRRFAYENVKVRKVKYRSAAKERRKAAIRLKQGGLQTPRDIGEEQPPFYMPARYRLLVKCLQEYRNSNRFSRKPMPDEVRLELAR